MKFARSYQNTARFLLAYQELWKNEIMLGYPAPLKDYPAHWIRALRAYDYPTIALRLSQGHIPPELPEDLRAWLGQIAALTELPVAARPPADLPAPSWVKIGQKKQHEIERLAPLVAQTAEHSDLRHVVDVGGGVGHLAQVLAHHYQLSVTSLDMDEMLQHAGKHWQSVKWPGSPHAVDFRAHRLERDDLHFRSLLTPHTLSTGLHTCGPLADHQIAAVVQAGAALVNLGCCYHKIPPSELPRSQVARELPLPWNLFALTLASGAHRKQDAADFAFKQKLKRKRYALHFLLHDHLATPGLVTLGNGSAGLYDGSFAAYAREQLRRLNLQSDWSDADLEAFAEDRERRKIIEDMIYAGILRDLLGRPLELALLFDRALWLEEHAYEVELQEIFDARRSPRNVALVAVRAN